MKKKQTNHTSGMIIIEIYLFVMLFAYPLAYNDYFFDITETKFYFYCVASLLFAFAYFISQPHILKKIKEYLEYKHNWFFLIFLISTAIGAILTPYPKNALLGNTGRYNGLVTFIVQAIVLFLLFCEKKLKRTWIYGMEAAGILTAILAILNHYKVDPLGFFKRMIPAEQVRFTSTIGNIDIFGEYISLILIAAAVLYCIQDITKKSFFHLFVVFITSVALLTNSTDGAFIGIIFYFVFFPFVLQSGTELQRYLHIIFTFCAGVMVAKILQGHFTPIKKLDGICSLLLNNIKIIVAVMVLLVIIGLSLRLLKCQFTYLHNIIKMYRIAVVVAILVGIVLFLLINAKVITPNNNNILSKILITDSWGSSRGYIWRMTLESYGELPFLQKLFGAGADSLFYILEKYRNVIATYGWRVDNAHNLYLQMFACHGIIGFLSWFFWLVISIKNGIKKCTTSRFNLVIVFVVIGYFLEALVGINAIHISGFLVVLTAMMQCEYT